MCNDPIVTYLSSLDLKYYAQVIGCAIGDLGHTVARDFYYGKKCAQENLRKLKLATYYLKIVEYYQAGVDDQCITELQIQNNILPTVANLLQITLPLPGIITSETEAVTSNGNLRLTENGGTRITEAGDFRIIE